MKILHVATSLDAWGGIEKYIVNVAGEHISRGHELFCTTIPGSPLDHHFPGKSIPISKRSKFDLTTARQHFDLIRSHRFDIVHVHFTPDIYVGAIAARLAGTKSLVLTRHVAEPWHPIKALHIAMMFSKIIAASEAVEKVLIRCYVPRNKIVVAKAGYNPAALQPDREEARNRLGFSNFTFGFVGRLTKEKGVDMAVEASKLSGHALEIYGEGPERDKLETSAAGFPQIRFHGFVENVSEVVTGLDCLLVPSRWMEAFPIAVLEAMAAGKPIIGFRVGGLPEMIVDGVTGILVPRDDVQSLSEAMNRLAADQEISNRMGAEAYRLYRQSFTADAMGSRIMTVYADVARASLH